MGEKNSEIPLDLELKLRQISDNIAMNIESEFEIYFVKSREIIYQSLVNDLVKFTRISSELIEKNPENIAAISTLELLRIGREFRVNPPKSSEKFPQNSPKVAPEFPQNSPEYLLWPPIA